MYYQLTCEIQDEGIAEIIKFDKKCNSIIEKWDLDIHFKRALQWYWFGSEIKVGPTLYSVKQIVQNEEHMNNLKNGLLVIGDSSNGDELCVNAKTLEVLFWNHEDVDDYDTRLLSDCKKLYNNVISLLINIRNRNYIPWDSFAAEEYYEIYKGN
jgi:hypothetical protein